MALAAALSVFLVAALWTSSNTSALSVSVNGSFLRVIPNFPFTSLTVPVISELYPLAIVSVISWYARGTLLINHAANPVSSSIFSISPSLSACSFIYSLGVILSLLSTYCRSVSLGLLFFSARWLYSLKAVLSVSDSSNSTGRSLTVGLATSTAPFLTGGAWSR